MMGSIWARWKLYFMWGILVGDVGGKRNGGLKENDIRSGKRLACRKVV